MLKQKTVYGFGQTHHSVSMEDLEKSYTNIYLQMVLGLRRWESKNIQLNTKNIEMCTETSLFDIMCYDLRKKNSIITDKKDIELLKKINLIQIYKSGKNKDELAPKPLTEEEEKRIDHIASVYCRTTIARIGNHTYSFFEIDSR